MKTFEFQLRNENGNEKGEQSQNPASCMAQTIVNDHDIKGKTPSTSKANSIAQSMSFDDFRLSGIKSTEPNQNLKCESQGIDLVNTEARQESPTLNEGQQGEERISQLSENLPPLPFFKPILKRLSVDIEEVLDDPGRNKRPEKWEGLTSHPILYLNLFLIF